jgi:hypothetical protein
MKEHFKKNVKNTTFTLFSSTKMNVCLLPVWTTESVSTKWLLSCAYVKMDFKVKRKHFKICFTFENKMLCHCKDRFQGKRCFKLFEHWNKITKCKEIFISWTNLLLYLMSGILHIQFNSVAILKELVAHI